MRSSTSYASYIAAWRKRLRKQRESDERRAQEARQRAITCARVLTHEFGAKRVYLFGSLTDGRFHAHSDIDLAVEGLESRLYFKALAELHRISDEFAVDIVPLEEHANREAILKKGERLDDLQPIDPSQGIHREGTDGTKRSKTGKG
jgi:predicted nucleotidyltransferase